MRLRLGQYLLFFVFFLPFSHFAQDWKLVVSSKVEKNDKALDGATVTVFKGTTQLEQKVTGGDGKFSVELPPNADYRLVVTKPGHVKKIFSFSTRGVGPDEGKDGFEFAIKAIELFEPPEDCNVGFLEQPLLKIVYDPNAKSFNYDETQSSASLANLNNVAGCIEEEKKKSKQFDKVMAEGANLMAKKDYAGAAKKFGEATNLKPKRDDAKTKLKEAQEMLANGSKIDADYKAAMDAGNAAMASKNYDEAIAQFTKAQGIKSSEPEPPKKIAEAQRLKEEANKGAANEKAYTDAMAEGNAAMGGSKWQDAITAFNKALTFKKGDATATAKIAECQAKLGGEQKYIDAMKKGDDAMTASKWQEAIAAYTAALGFKAGDVTATKKKADAEAKLAEENKNKDAQKAYDAAMKKGDAAVTAKKWDEAIAAFTEALTYKKDDAVAKQKLADAQAKQKEEAGAKELQAKYDAAMKKGDDAMAGSKWSDAVAAYTEALTYKKDDAVALKKKADAEAKVKEEAGAKELQAKYDAAMKKGDGAMTAKKWDEAIAAYTEALTYKKDDAAAKQKLADAQAKQKEELGAKELQAKYDAAMKKGDDAMSGSKWSDAVAAYSEALTYKKDDAVALKKKADAEAKIKEEAGAKELQAKYDAAMKKGDAAVTAKKWDEAIAAFTEALTYKKDDAVAKQKLADAQAKQKEELGAKELQAKYDAAMKKGDDAMTGSKWSDAVTAYTEALTYKKDDAVALKKKADAEAKVKEEAGAKELQAKYDAAMKKGDGAMTAKKWDEAIAAYTEALTYKKDDAAAKQKLADAQAKQKEELGAKELQAKYDAAMKKGDGDVTVKKWDEAIAAFTEALTYKKDDAAAKQKLADAQAKQKEELGAKELQAKYDAAMKKGDAAMTSKTYQAAIDAYVEALGYKKDDAVAIKKKGEAETALKKEAADKLVQEKFDAAMKKGDDAVAGTKWQEAVNAFTEALTYKKDDATAKQKLADAQAKLNAELGDKAAQQKYDEAMKKGDAAMSTSKFSEAIAAYTSALGFKKDDPAATQKLAEAKAKLEEQNKNAAMEAKYLAAMKKGDAEMTAKKWKEAVVAFTEALAVKAEDPAAKQKLAEAQEKINAELGAKEIQAKYDAAMKDGDAAKLAKDYQKALEHYNSAQSIKPDAKEPPVKIAEVNKLIAAMAEKEAAFNKAMEEGKTFFAAKEYEKALGAYIRAKSLKEDHPDPPVKISEIQKIISELRLDSEAKAKIEAEYQKFMKEGKAHFDKKEYSQALEKYILARDLKKEEPEPPAKIEEINKLLEGDKQNEANYQQAMKDGAAAVTAKDYEKALERFNHAKDLKPKATEPPIKIAEVNKLIKEEADAKLKEQQYEAAMKEGIDDETKKNWTGAITAFEKALTIRPGDAEATRRLNEAKAALKDKNAAEKILEEQKRIDEQYKKEIGDGVAAFTGQDYKKALGHYTAAQKLKPSEPLPPQKIDEINKILKQLEEDEKLKLDQSKLDAEYTKAMDDGNKAVLEKKYEVALDRFRHAKNIKPKETEPPYKIAEVEELMRKQKENADAEADRLANEAKYKQAFKLGMDGITKKDWKGAKAKFEEAMKHKPNDEPAKQKIDYVNQMMAADLQKTKDADYKAAIDRGNNHFKHKKYPEALKDFTDALAYKPNDPYATQKIEELKKLVKPNEIVQNPPKTRNPLLDKYPQGVTEENVQQPGVFVTRRIVIRGEEVKVYEKKYYSWGNLTFYRDGVQITQSAFDTETAP